MEYLSEWYSDFVSKNKRAPDWGDAKLEVEKSTSDNSKSMQLPTVCPDPNCNAPMISIPLKAAYRLIMKDTGNDFIPIKVMTHEDYNNFMKCKSIVYNDLCITRSK